MEIYPNFRYRTNADNLRISGETLDIKQVVTKM